jgi:cellulose synthase/poly-beta-1,6-N-acetylglucosamine synthase-like glycosyltransferase
LEVTGIDMLANRKILNPLAPPFLIAGLALMTWWNWRQWQRDKALAARWRADMETSPVLNATPSVSVLVTAWDEAENIQAHIESFLKLRYPKKQLVLCAGGSDHTYAIAHAYTKNLNCVVIEQMPGEGKQRALQRCLRYATGDIIYLTDADCILNNDAFERILAPLINDGEAAATGTSLPLPEQQGNPIVTYSAAVDQYLALTLPALSAGLLGRNCAITRNALEATGEFSRDTYSGTDYTLARQLITNGYFIRSVNTSVVATKHPDTLRQYYRQRIRWLRNIVVIGRLTDDTPQVVQALIGMGISIAFLTLLLLGPIIGLFALVCWLLLVFHAVAMRWRRILLLPNLTWGMRVKTLFAAMMLFVMDLFVRIAGVIQGFIPQRRTAWKQPIAAYPRQESDTTGESETAFERADEVSA